MALRLPVMLAGVRRVEDPLHLVDSLCSWMSGNPSDCPVPDVFSQALYVTHLVHDKFDIT